LKNFGWMKAKYKREKGRGRKSPPSEREGGGETGKVNPGSELVLRHVGPGKKKRGKRGEHSEKGEREKREKGKETLKAVSIQSPLIVPVAAQRKGKVGEGRCPNEGKGKKGGKELWPEHLLLTSRCKPPRRPTFPETPLWHHHA